MTEFNPQHAIDHVVSLAQGLGAFEAVNGHEPKTPPSSAGLTAAVWADYLGPVPSESGLSRTSGLLILKKRTYTTMQTEPEDAIDPAVLAAEWAFMAVVSADFDLGIEDEDGDPAAWVDLLGRSRSRLESRAGYLAQGDQTFRVMTTDVPIIITDLWSQAQ